MSRTPIAHTPRLDNLRGILWMLAAVTSLTVMFAIIKQMTLELPFFVVAITRTLVALLLLGPWLMRVGLAGIATDRMRLHFLRACCGIASFASVVYALGHLLLADAMVLSFTSPFWSILISALILGEAIRRYRTVATVVGFCGVLMIVKPQGGIDPAMLVALLSAVLTSVAMISMKSLSASEPPTRIVFYFFLYGTLLLIIPAALTWQTPTAIQFAWLAAAGLLGWLGQIFLARAYDAADVTVVTPFDFVRLPLAALFGFLFFAEVPDIWSGAGTLVIIGALLFITRHEARARRPRTA